MGRVDELRVVVGFLFVLALPCFRVEGLRMMTIDDDLISHSVSLSFAW